MSGLHDATKKTACGCAAISKKLRRNDLHGGEIHVVDLSKRSCLCISMRMNTPAPAELQVHGKRTSGKRPNGVAESRKRAHAPNTMVSCSEPRNFKARRRATGFAEKQIVLRQPYDLGTLALNITTGRLARLMTLR